MTKRVIFFSLMALLLTCLFSSLSSYAYSGGLLNGKLIHNGSSPTSSVSTSYDTTDNSLSTNDPVFSSSDAYLWYEFNTPVTIGSYILKGWEYESPVKMIFYNSAGDIIKTISNAVQNYTIQQITPVVDVKKVALKYEEVTENGAIYFIYEWDVFEAEQVPNEPNELTATPGNTQVSLEWASVTGADTYTIKRSTTAGGPYTTIETGVTGTTYTDTDVVNGTTYYYVVTAVNAGGESDPSNEASATPQAPVEPDTTRALLTLYLTGGQIKEYDLSAAQLDAFLDWYDAKAAETGPARYGFEKTWNRGPFKTRTEYVIFKKIDTFDVDEYEVDEE